MDGRRVSTDIYYLNAIRLADELAALSSAPWRRSRIWW